MRPIFYTSIKFCATDNNTTIHNVGKQIKTMPEMVKYAHTLGYELIQFNGWDGRSVERELNDERIDDLLNGVEIVCVNQVDPDGNPNNKFYPQIHDYQH